MRQIGLSITVLAVFCLVLSGCGSGPAETVSKGETDKDTSFMSIGSFSVKPVAEGWTEVRDGAGRTLVLVPRGRQAPAGYASSQIVRTPGAPGGGLRFF